MGCPWPSLGVVAITLGGGPAVDFSTAWLLEKSLSVDNLFVFALIFGYFQVPAAYQHRVLFFGVFGALVFRGIFLGAGVALVSQFTAVLFVFGAVLVYSAVKPLRGDDDAVDPGRSLAVRALRKVTPVAQDYHATRFLARETGRRVATPLLAVVVAIEAADLVFAVDSVPAVLAVSDDPFILYSGNAFAILGLRALYFLLAGLLQRFHHLSKTLAFILAFIGAKLFLQAGPKTISTSIPEIPSLLSLAVIVVALTAAVVLSLRRPQPQPDNKQLTAARRVDRRLERASACRSSPSASVRSSPRMSDCEDYDQTSRFRRGPSSRGCNGCCDRSREVPVSRVSRRPRAVDRHS